MTRRLARAHLRPARFRPTSEDHCLGLVCLYLYCRYCRSIRAIAPYLRMGRDGDLLVYIEAALSGSFCRVCRPVESLESVGRGFGMLVRAVLG